MNIREAFLSAVEQDEPGEFLEYVEKHNSKNETFDIPEVLQTLSKKLQERLWGGLKVMCNKAILKATPSIEEEEEDEASQKFSMLLSCLQGVTTVALCAVSLDKPYVPSTLLETAVIIHGIMMSLPDQTQKLQNSIAQLCETWFINDLDGKEELITNTFPFLVIRALAKRLVGDVKRIWAMRQSLLLMDFEDESSEPLKQLLQQCMIHPIFLRAEEGRRFLSFLFGMHPDFTKDLHKTIKNQIPNCSLGVLSFYGEIYFRSWKVASGPYLEVIEKDCFQDLMYAAVHAQRAGVQSMSSRLRKILNYFHQQKKQQGVDEALVRLYQPILWRAFKVANPMVRANAAALLIDAFPLQNPDATNKQADELLQKQFDILQALFEDPSPVVRATGVHGVCRIACVFWELIPVHTIKALLNKLICEVAFDASSSTVRVAVFQGLKFLLENHLSHPLLKMLLGNLRDLIHDVSEKVRLAFVDLLLLVKGIKAIKFWAIVPLEHLLGSLEVETSAPVLRKLVKLLMNSFHPLNKEAEVQITRCAALWQANPVAARKFYQYAHLHTTVPTTGKFILLLCRCLMQWDRNVAPSSNESLLSDNTIAGSILDSTENKENEFAEEAVDAVLTLPDADTISGILETIAISWAGIKDQLEKRPNENIKSKLTQHFTKALPKLLSTFDDSRARAAIVVISAHLPPNCLPAFSKKCLSTLSSLQDGANSQDFGPMLDCLCSWGQAGKVLEIVHSSLLNNLSDSSSTGVKHAKQTSKSDKLQPSTAVDFLFWILYQPPCREAVMGHQEKLQNIAGTLKDVTNLIESVTVIITNKRSMHQDVKELYPKALKMFCHLHIHLDNKTFRASEEMTELLIWAEKVLLPRLDIYTSDDSSSTITENGKRPSEENVRDHYCSKEFLEVILSCSSELIKLGMANEEFCCQATVLTKSVTLLGEKGLPLLPHLSQLMYQMSQRIMFMDVEQHTDTTKDHTQAILTDILKAISSNQNAENITQVLLEMKSPLAEVLKAYECKKQTVLSLLTDKPQIMASTMAACLAELSQQTLDFGEQPSSTDLPRLSSFILSILMKSKVLLRSFVEELEQCVISGAVQDKVLLLSAQFMLSTIVNTNSKVDNLKSCGLQILQQIEQLPVDQDTSGNNHEINMEQVQQFGKNTLDQLGVVC